MLSADPAKVHKALSELRDSIETVTQNEYDRFLRLAITLFLQFVKDTSDNTLVDSHEHRIRTLILEIINRLPLNESMRAQSKPLMKMVLNQLTIDNEDNGLILLRILSDLHKAYRQTFEPEVVPFLEYVMKLYSQLPATVHRNFTSQPEAAVAPPGMALGQPPPSPNPLGTSMQLGSSGALNLNAPGGPSAGSMPPGAMGPQGGPQGMAGQDPRRPTALIPAHSSFKVRVCVFNLVLFPS